MHKRTDLCVLGGLIGSTVVAGMALAGPGADAARWANATASVTVESTCSMTATIAQGDEHTATLVNGTYSSGSYPNGIGKTTIQTFCNDQNGYAIYAIGFTGDTLGNTKLHSSALGSSYDIVTGTATNGTGAGGDVSNWAMKVTAVTGNGQTYAPEILNGFGSFSAVPSAYTKVARLDRATDSSAGTNIGSSIETTYAAYISNTQPAGTYTGQVKYALVHPGTTAAPGAKVMQEVASWKNTLLPGEQVQAVDNRDGKTYTVALLSVDEDGDGQQEEGEYSEVWMTQNLDLDICVNTDPEKCGSMTLTSANTDLNSYSGLSGYSYDSTTGLITWTPSDNTLKGSPATITNFASGNPANSVTGWSNTNTGAKMADGDNTIIYYGTKFEDDPVGTENRKTALQKCEAAGHSEAVCLHYKVGNYYNWTAAVAMNDTTSYTAKSTVMPNSICPKGWRLPDGPVGNNTISDFNTLLNAYNIANGNDYGTGSSSVNVGYKDGGFAKMGAAPLYFARSGYVYGSTLYYFSTSGGYWSSTVFSSDDAYYLGYSSSGLYPASRGNRSYGRSVRCIAR